AAQTTANNAAANTTIVMGFAQSIDARVTQQEVELQYLQVNSVPSGNNTPSSDGNARPDAAPPTPASATGADAIAIGSASVASGDNSMAIGVGATAAQANATALGAGATTTRAGQVKLGGAGSSVTVGDITQSTAAQSGATEVMTVDATGTIGRDTTIRPMLTMHNTQISAMQATLTAQNTAIAGIDSRLGTLSLVVNQNNRAANAGIAESMAMANLPQANAPGKSMISFGLAGHEGEAAGAFGFSHAMDNGNVIIRASGSYSPLSSSAGAGIGFQF
ncbi:MAG: YadA-like family protein, partial [Pseudomonadota bacterium]